MKYIKTENGVFEFTENMHITENYLIDSYVNDEDVFGNKDIMYEDLGKIIKQADTIEELCDSFVAIGNKHLIWDKQHLDVTFEQVKQSYSAYGIFDIYGAIWTSKGLIYVAKINDKGELVLI